MNVKATGKTGNGDQSGIWFVERRKGHYSRINIYLSLLKQSNRSSFQTPTA